MGENDIEYKLKRVMGGGNRISTSVLGPLSSL